MNSTESKCHNDHGFYSACSSHAGLAQLRKWRLLVISSIGAAVLLLAVGLRKPLTDRSVLANESPSPELVEEMIEDSPDSAKAVLAAWKSQKIVHRQVAVRLAARLWPRTKVFDADLELMMLSAALDPDLSVRESAMSALQAKRHPALPALAAAQLRDCDPQIRLLGLNHLKTADAAVGVPMVIRLLDDSDPFVVAMGLKLLEKWSGEKFGVKLNETAAVENEKTGLKEFREGSREKAKAGAERAKTWWLEHQKDYPPVALSMPGAASPEVLPASDFDLRSLNGDKVRLSDFRGKVVLINFWTTWCTACVSEIPELIALQKQNSQSLVVLGVSLDYVPDSHGHIGGHAAVEEQGHSDGHHDDHEATVAALKRVREKVARTVKARGINYPVLLDEKNEAGGRYNGGELPTTVIVDVQGNVRRRFIGARSLEVFEAMIAEATALAKSHDSFDADR